MAASIPVLWSDDIKVDVLTPLAILRAQVEPLRKKTQGLLEAEVTTSTSGDNVLHKFDLIAPALGGYRRRILTATHQKEMIYPVTVEAECFATPPPRSYTALQVMKAFELDDSSSAGEEDGRRKAVTDQEFINLVGEALRSSQVRGAIQSLIARSNELQEGSADSPATETAEGAS